MKVILLQDVATLGKAGEVKDVRNGYGLNFLLPKGLAELATEAALKRSEQLRAGRAAAGAALAAKHRALAETLGKKTFTIRSRSKEGKLFGSVSAKDIAEAVAASGTAIDSKHIVLEKPIKETGTHTVEVRFEDGVATTFTVAVEAEEERVLSR